MTQLKSAVLVVAVYALGVVVGIGLFLLASLALGLFGFPPGYALYNGYFVVIALWGIAAIVAYLRTKKSTSSTRWNVAAFMAGVVTFSLLGGVAVLIRTPQFLIFWPH